MAKFYLEEADFDLTIALRNYILFGNKNIRNKMDLMGLGKMWTTLIQNSKIKK